VRRIITCYLKEKKKCCNLARVADGVSFLHRMLTLAFKKVLIGACCVGFPSGGVRKLALNNCSRVGVATWICSQLERKLPNVFPSEMEAEENIAGLPRFYRVAVLNGTFQLLCWICVMIAKERLGCERKRILASTYEGDELAIRVSFPTDTWRSTSSSVY
jgi:hypothetical protein